MTKEDILNQMKFHQAEYSKLNEEYKKLKQVDEAANYVTKQLARLEEFKVRYKFYANTSKGEPEVIDWEKVETQIKAGDDRNGPALGWDETGMPGFGGGYGGGSGHSSGGWFSPMVEEEGDIKKYLEREEKRREIAARRR